jgi:hypothetical protein
MALSRPYSLQKSMKDSVITLNTQIHAFTGANGTDGSCFKKTARLPRKRPARRIMTVPGCIGP